MKIKINTLGCKLNFAESSALGKRLLDAGHEKVKVGEEADVCIINTCSVTDVADQKGRQLIRRMHREHPHACIIVTGCYAQLQPCEVAAIEGVDYVIGANDKEKIIEIIGQRTKDEEQRLHVTDLATPASRLSEEGSAFHAYFSSEDRTRCFLKVQDGCDYYCTYCTIPNARGRSRNASIADTVALAEEALRQGAKEIVLTGVNIGDFGRSTGETFFQLVQALDAIEGEFRIRISSCEPNLLSDEIINFVAQSKHFAPHFHIPLQSGSDEVLKIMHRRYDTALFAERVHRIKQLMPHAFIGVDCMVGVRGETEEMFNDYVRFISALPVTQLHVFPYSERAHTRMVEMDLPRVKPQEQKRRVDVLMHISDEKLHAFYEEHKGRKGLVLWEGKTKGNQMEGWTENYIRVAAPYDAKKINTFEEVEY